MCSWCGLSCTHLYNARLDLTYFDCKEILEIVKELDGEAKSLFGQYTAPRVKVDCMYVCVSM